MMFLTFHVLGVLLFIVLRPFYFWVLDFRGDLFLPGLTDYVLFFKGFWKAKGMWFHSHAVVSFGRS